MMLTALNANDGALLDITALAAPEVDRLNGKRVARREVIERDGHICQLCGGPVKPHDIHIDHIHPRSRGGRDTPDNLQVAHSRCNMQKGARLSWPG